MLCYGLDYFGFCRCAWKTSWRGGDEVDACMLDRQDRQLSHEIESNVLI